MWPTLVPAAVTTPARRSKRRSIAIARDASTYTNLGLIHLETGQPERAVARLGEALLLDPESPRALGALAEALDRLGFADRSARVRAAIKR